MLLGRARPAGRGRSEELGGFAPSPAGGGGPGPGTPPRCRRRGGCLWPGASQPFSRAVGCRRPEEGGWAEPSRAEPAPPDAARRPSRRRRAVRGRDGDMAETGSVHATRFEAAVKVIQSLPKNGECGLGGGGAGGTPVASARGLAARLAPARRAGPGGRGEARPLSCRRPLPPGQAAPGQGRWRGPPGGPGRGGKAALPQPPRRRLENRWVASVLVLPVGLS